MTEINPPTADELLALARAGVKTKKVEIRVPVFDRETWAYSGDYEVVKGRRLINSNVAIGKQHKKSPSTLYLMHPDVEDQALGAILTLKGGGLLKGGEDILLAWLAHQLSDLPAPRSHTDVKGEVHSRMANVVSVMTSSHGAMFDDAYREHRDEKARAKLEREERDRRELVERLSFELICMSAPKPGPTNLRNRPVCSEDAIRRAAPFASKDSDRINIDGVVRFIDGKAIATDGHRIMMVRTSDESIRSVNVDGSEYEPEDRTAFDKITKAILDMVTSAGMGNNAIETIDGPFLYAVVSRMAKLHEVSNKTARDQFIDFRIVDGRLMVSMMVDPVQCLPGGLDHPITVDLGRSAASNVGMFDAGSVFGISPHYLKEALEGITGPVVISYAWDAERDMQLIEVERDGEVCIIASCGRKSTIQRARWYMAGMEG